MAQAREKGHRRLESNDSGSPVDHTQSEPTPCASSTTAQLWRWLTLERGLTHHLDDGAVSVDNNYLERQMKPWAMGRKAWMFAGGELAGQRAAIVMSLVNSAKLNGHDPWAYLRDVLTRLLSHPYSRVGE